MEYQFREIEKKWQQYWKEHNTYRVPSLSAKPKCYVLDMFPYPSGAGLHVGHPLGYIASDIYSRYKRLKGFNVLHTMGYDAFGLPAEQYAIENGVHPAVSTDQNIANFRRQLDNIGFCFDWEREVRTSDPKYYKWTQWIFLQLFGSWYNRKTNKAEPIGTLTAIFDEEGNAQRECPGDETIRFTAEAWKGFDEQRRMEILMQYRIAYCGYGEVNWCEALGTVLANDEVVNGVSERGGHPVQKKRLRQWYLRITEYANRLLEGLTRVDFSDAMKEMQTNWIGKSTGAEITFRIQAPSRPSPKGKENPAAEQGWATARNSTYEYTKELKEKLKKNPTEAENLLWSRLRANQTGYHIRRQHIIDRYIADFVCLKAKIIIEVDGGYHDTNEQKQYDEERSAFLSGLGFEVIRFTNEEVMNNTDAVVEGIVQKLNSVSPAGQVSPFGGDLEGALVVYTTRPDTIFGADFMVLAPEHELVEQITTPEQKQAVEAYIAYVKSRSERERMAEKKISGCFTGAYAINPLSGREIPVWISEYVLAGYGTGAIMAVPCGDERDHKFAKHFNIPITNIIGEHYNGEEANPTKDAVLENSGFLNGMVMREAIDTVVNYIEDNGLGKRKVNYKMRDAAFSRQRYWGEPFPITWKDGIARPLPEIQLPLELPYVESYKPGPEGEGPLANVPEWVAKDLETNTMPGYAGSSWYFLRYMDPHNDKEFCDRTISDYWNQVDVYVGGTEHAVGHLLYSRMWTKCLYDLGHIGYDEPFKRLLNQGMIQGVSELIYRYEGYDADKIYTSMIDRKGSRSNTMPYPVPINVVVSKMIGFRETYAFYYSADIVDEAKKSDMSMLHVPIKYVNNNILNIDEYKKDLLNDERVIFVSAGGFYKDGFWYNWNSEKIDPLDFKSFSIAEKMSKRYGNVVNPDDVVEKYGADTFRMYEMFLGPVEMSKPWDTKGIEGVHRFLKKLWRLFYDDVKGGLVNSDAPTPAELKALHKTIKKIAEDTERFSFNTSVSAFMVCVNELTDLKCHKKDILQQLLILLAPYAPHISEELWQSLGNNGSVLDAQFPVYDAQFLAEASKEYPVSINGKLRTTLVLPTNVTAGEAETAVLSNEVVQKWMEGKPHKKIVFVPNKMINVVV